MKPARELLIDIAQRKERLSARAQAERLAIAGNAAADEAAQPAALDPEEKRELLTHMRRLSCISPYLVVLMMPGGMLVLPVLAWWLDRRRNRRPSSTVVQG